MWIRVYPSWKMNFNSKNGIKRSLSYESKASIHLSQLVEWIYGAQSLKEWRFPSESMFVPIEKRTLNLKIAQIKVFLMKPRHKFFYPNG